MEKNDNELILWHADLEDTEKSIRLLNIQVQSSKEDNLVGFLNAPKNNCWLTEIKEIREGIDEAKRIVWMQNNI